MTIKQKRKKVSRRRRLYLLALRITRPGKRSRRTRRWIAQLKRQYHRAKGELTVALRRRRYRNGQLSPNFNVREFHCNDGTPVPRAAWPALRRLCIDYLEPMREKFGPASITSGHRTVVYNRSVGGATYSEHIYTLDPTDLAADAYFARGTPDQWGAYARRLRVKGIGVYTRKGFIHMDNRHGAPARWRITT